MQTARETVQATTQATIQRLQELRAFGGSPDEFWAKFLAGACHLALGRAALLLVLADPAAGATGAGNLADVADVADAAGAAGAAVGEGGGAASGRAAGEAQHARTWNAVTVWPPGRWTARDVEGLTARAQGIAEQARESGHGVQPAGEGLAGAPSVAGTSQTPGGASTGALVAFRVDAGPGSPASVVVLWVEAAPVAHLEASTVLLRMIGDVPASYQRERALRQATSDVVRFAQALDVLALLNADQRYVKAAMTFATELAGRYRCDRVSLGWLEGDYVQLSAISHMEKFERRTDAVQAMEACMEEVLDQDEEIVWPPPAGQDAVVHAHDLYARAYSPGRMVSLPVRLDGAGLGVLFAERAAEPFAEAEVASLRLLCDQAARRLADLHHQDRWLGRKLLDAVRGGLAWLVGVEHTLAKSLGLLAAIGVWVLVLGSWNYRVEGPFLLKTDDLIFLPAPFDGYIDQVQVEIGDAVKKGDLLLTLDTRELLVDESAAVAEMSRHARDAEKAQAKDQLADMKISLALEDQAKARRDKIRYHLDSARVIAPMSGLVVEGDLKKLLGAPVRKGDALFKIARTERTYVEIAVDERDVHEVQPGATGEVAFVSRPNLSFPIVVERVDPISTPHEGRNDFDVKATFRGSMENWWRPGMSGVAKVEAGRRSLLWILMHRTIDYLRMVLWW